MLKRFIAPLLAAVFLAGSVVVLGGCNTVEGAGKDISRGGDAIRDEAREQRR